MSREQAAANLRRLLAERGGQATGMSLRDWFAGVALSGSLSHIGPWKTPEREADDAYRFADAMLDARAPGEEDRQDATPTMREVLESLEWSGRRQGQGSGPWGAEATAPWCGPARRATVWTRRPPARVTSSRAPTGIAPTATFTPLCPSPREEMMAEVRDWMDDDEGHRVSTEQLCAAIGEELAGILQRHNAEFPDLPDVGFCLMLFTFGDGGFASWLSNAERESMVQAVEELLERVRDGGADGYLSDEAAKA